MSCLHTLHILKYLNNNDEAYALICFSLMNNNVLAHMINYCGYTFNACLIQSEALNEAQNGQFIEIYQSFEDNITPL